MWDLIDNWCDREIMGDRLKLSPYEINTGWHYYHSFIVVWLSTNYNLTYNWLFIHCQLIYCLIIVNSSNVIIIYVGWWAFVGRNTCYKIKTDRRYPQKSLCTHDPFAKNMSYWLYSTMKLSLSDISFSWNKLSLSEDIPLWSYLSTKPSITKNNPAKNFFMWKSRFAGIPLWCKSFTLKGLLANNA